MCLGAKNSASPSALYSLYVFLTPPSLIEQDDAAVSQDYQQESKSLLYYVFYSSRLTNALDLSIRTHLSLPRFANSPNQSTTSSSLITSPLQPHLSKSQTIALHAPPFFP